MDTSTWHDRRNRILWSINSACVDEANSPRHRWWWDNRHREPNGAVVVQIVTKGCFVLRDSGGDRLVETGFMALFAYGEPTCYGMPPDRPDLHTELLSSWAVLTGAGLRDHWDVLRARVGPVIPLTDERLRRLIAKAAANRSQPTGSIEDAAALVGAIAEAVAAAAGAVHTPVEAAIERILADPCATIPIKALARDCGCSREHLVRSFAQQVGEAPAAWQRRRRLERALDLLRETDLTVAEVATRCGALTAHRLARWTASAFKATPLALRRASRTPGRHRPSTVSRG